MAKWQQIEQKFVLRDIGKSWLGFHLVHCATNICPNAKNWDPKAPLSICGQTKTAEADNLQIYNKVVAAVLHILAVDVSILILQFLNNCSFNFEKVNSFGNGNSNDSSSVVQISFIT